MFQLTEEHKKHLLFLINQPTQVVQDFCKLALDYLHKGPNQKIYGAAAQKLQVEPETIQSSIEGLLNLLLECTKHKKTPDDFKELLSSLGFDQEKEELLMKLYLSQWNEISGALSNTGFKLPEYHDMEWRFEVEVASRSISSQVVPKMTLDFSLKNADKSDKLQHVCLQTDASNLRYLCQQIETAMHEGRSQHIRKLKRILK